MISRQVLLFGGSGLLGSAVMRELEGAGLSVFAPPRIAMDITDGRGLRALVEAERPQVIINTAAYAGVDAAEDDRFAARSVNAKGAGLVAEAARTCGAVLIHISTDFVFDGTASKAYAEDDAIAPVNWYGTTKAEGEALVREANGSRSIILRTAWLHGASRSCFVRTIAERLLVGNRVHAISDRLASPTSVDHLAEQIVALARRVTGDEGSAAGTYHLAGEGGSSPYDIALAIADHLTSGADLVTPIDAASHPGIARRPAFAVLDTARAYRDLGLSLAPWRQGLARTLDAITASHRRAA